MAKAFAPSVVTANDLVEGMSVFLAPGGWTRDIAVARIAATPEAAAMLEAEGTRAEHANLVVDPYLVEVSLATGRPVPLTRREQIRASGLPTIPVGPEAEPAPQRVAA